MQLVGKPSGFLPPLDGQVIDVDDHNRVWAMCPIELAPDVAKYLEFRFGLAEAQERLQEAVQASVASAQEQVAAFQREPAPAPWAWGPYRKGAQR